MIKVKFLILRLVFIFVMSALNLIACNFGPSTQVSRPPANPTTPGSLTPRPGSSGTTAPQAQTDTKTPLSSLTPASFFPTPGVGAVTLISSSPITTLSPAVTTGKESQTQKTTPVCNRAAPGNPIDISIPDDTQMQPGQSFTKTWRIINIGDCPWTRDYSVVFFSGRSLGAALTNYFTKRVAPGDSIDISLDMVSPINPGTYQGNWKLSNAQDQLFGIGPAGDSPFWVRIVVVEPNTPTPEPVLPTKVPTVAVATTGVATLKLNDALDLDSNKITAPPNDILFATNAAKALLLTPQSGARLSVFGKNEPQNSDCLSENLGKDPIIIDTLSNGTFFCYQTKLGQPGWLRLVTLDLPDNTVSMDFLTWVIP